AAEPETPAYDDRPVTPRQAQLVHRLRVETGRQSLLLGPLAAERKHVGRHVATVDVQAGAQPRHQQPSGPAGDIERRLAAILDEALEIRDLGPVPVEHRPPAP